MFRFRFGIVGLLAVVAIAAQANASVVFNGSGGGLSAQAKFTVTGGNTLEILLTNTDAATGAGAPVDPGSVLSGLFFNIGSVTLTPQSATIDPGGMIIQDGNCYVPANCGPSVKNVGGEWSHSPVDPNWLPGTQQGISSSGYLPSNASSGNFGGPDLESPNGLNGIEFGIVPVGWVPGSGKGGLDNNALIAGTVKFVLKAPVGVTLTEAMISDVYFTYGTASTDPYLMGTKTTGATSTSGGVPEPAVLSLLGLGLAGLCYRVRRPKD